ncbi:MAG: hypothetical protein QOG04_240 [Actinomycetota bacterium]|jgi:hypothetical protein|nr:hypothetical protein [Actinomycetota bacterium]
MNPRFPELCLPVGHIGANSLQQRAEAINEAIAWKIGASFQDRETTVVSTFDSHSVRVEKPGKEFDFSGEKFNPNDMLPGAYLKDQRIPFTPTFGEIWKEIEDFSKAGEKDAVELIACLLFRAAYMLDHVQANTGWRFEPPERVMSLIEAQTPTVETAAGQLIPVRVFLHLIEAVSLNEDVKYYGLAERKSPGTGIHRIKGGIGRRNNLTTCAHLIAVLLEKPGATVVKFGGAMASRRGMAPITPPTARRWFPALSPT